MQKLSNLNCVLFDSTQLTDLLFAELPRVRLDKVVRRAQPKPFWEAPPTLEEEPEDGITEVAASPNLSTASDGIKLNMTLQNLGKFTFPAHF